MTRPLRMRAVSLHVLLTLAAGSLACGTKDSPRRAQTAPHTDPSAPGRLLDGPAEIDASGWTLSFELDDGERPRTCSLDQSGVEGAWVLSVNGQELGLLPRNPSTMRSHFELPAAALTSGTNSLRLAPARADQREGISVSALELREGPLVEALDVGELFVQVHGGPEGPGIPARLAFVDAQGRLAAIVQAAAGDFALRPGIAYVGADGRGFGLPAGDYELFATRGMEWSLARETVHVEGGQRTSLHLALTRELDTAGWIAADTHIHTVTFSGHGDASVEERVLTLAGEGVELAVATDHNHVTDYASAQHELDLDEHFLAVRGNEVTTDNGHFTAFPFAADAPVPNHQQSDWVRLVADIRAAGAELVLLNHPHWPQLHSGPFAVLGLDPSSGSWAAHGRGAFGLDGMELVNSTTLDAEPLGLFHDWFALLNAGERLVAVGSSDSHTVGDPVGQGRCYVPSASDDPASIDLDAAISAYREGRVSVAMGIFTQLRVPSHDAGPGDTITVEGGGELLSAEVRVAAPAWVHPRELLVFVNGVERSRRAVPDGPGPEDAWHEVEVPLPPLDSYIVAVVIGDGLELPGWPLMADYTLAATNPIYIERDGEAGWSSLRERAEALLDAQANTPERARELLESDRSDPFVGQLDHAYAARLRTNGRSIPPWLRARLKRHTGAATHDHEHAMGTDQIQ